MRTINILGLPVDTTGCGWYRVRQPLNMIKKHTMHETYVLDSQKNSGDEILYALRNSNIVLVRQGAERSVREIKAIKGFKNFKWALDMDDHPELVSPYSDHYAEGGTKEFYDANLGKWLWKDGENGFDIARNKEHLKSLQDGFKEATLVTVTTERLADYVRQFTKRVAVLPNCVDFNRWWKLPLKKDPEKLRIGWSGGSSHYEDWYDIKKPLNKLLRKYKFTLVLIGVDFSGVIDEDLRKYVEFWDWDAWEAHSFRMMALNLDISLIPLANLPFNHYKSTIKLAETAAMAVPSLVANVPPYDLDIEDAVNCYSYKTEAEFEHQLEFLIRNSSVREQIGNNAYEWVRDKYNAAKNAHLWSDAYLEAIDKII